LANSITNITAVKSKGRLYTPPATAISFLTGLSAYQEARTKKKKRKELNSGRYSSFFIRGKKVSLI
jgi:hypothetical protein